MTPETQNIEWKRSWRDEYLAWICGFANAHGGRIEIGKNDRGEVVGVRNVLSLLEEIPSKVQSLLGIVVDVNLKSDDPGLEFIEIVVRPHTNPISYRGRFHYRSGSTKQVLEGPALTRLLLERHGRTWDDVPLPGVSLKSLDSRAFDEFRRRGAESQRLPQSIMDESDESVIEKLCLREAGFLKRAAVLLFHPEPHRFITEAYLTADAAARGTGIQDTTRKTTNSGFARNRPENHQKTARATGKTTSNTTGKTSRDDSRSRILSMLREQPAITQPDIAARLGVTLDGVRYHFRKLQAEGVIRRAGSRKSGHWEILGDEEPSP